MGSYSLRNYSDDAVVRLYHNPARMKLIEVAGDVQRRSRRPLDFAGDRGQLNFCGLRDRLDQLKLRPPLFDGTSMRSLRWRSSFCWPHILRVIICSCPLSGPRLICLQCGHTRRSCASSTAASAVAFYTGAIAIRSYGLLYPTGLWSSTPPTHLSSPSGFIEGRDQEFPDTSWHI